MLIRYVLAAAAVALCPLLWSPGAYAETSSEGYPWDTYDPGEEVIEGTDTNAAPDDSAVFVDEGPGPDITECFTDFDCGSGYHCDLGRCWEGAKGCFDDSACGVGQYCNRYDKCAKDERKCVSDADCPTDGVCLWEECFERGLRCLDVFDCGYYTQCTPQPGLGICTVDAENVPAYGACADACAATAECAGLSNADCLQYCHYSAANGAASEVDALVTCATDKSCGHIETSCDIGEGSAIRPTVGLLLPSGAPMRPEPPKRQHLPPTQNGSSVSGSGVEDGGCSAGRQGPSAPLALGLAVLFLVVLRRLSGTREQPSV